MSGKHYTGIDVFKFIACVLIVMLHTSVLQRHSEAGYYFQCFCRLAVPYFFTVSSFLFWSGRKDIKQFTFRLLRLYAFWFVVQSPFIVKSYFIDTDNSILYQFCVFVRNLIFNSTFTASWFIIALIEAQLLVWWLSKRLSNCQILVVGAVCYFFCLFSSLYYGVFNWGWTHFLSAHFPWANSVFAAVIFVALGKVLVEKSKEHDVSKSRLFIFSVLTVIFGVVEVALLKNTGYRITDSFVMLIPAAVVLSLISIKTQIQISLDSCSILRKSSIMIYVSHGSILAVICHFNSGCNGISLFLLTFGIAMLLALSIIYISRTVPFLRYAY